MSNQVGYGRPPLHSRFRKGQSGNPGGQFRSGAARSRPPQDLQQVLLRALGRKAPIPPDPRDAPVPGSHSRGRRRVTWREAIVTRLIEQSASGDLRATRLLAELMWHCEPPPPEESATDEYDPVDELIAEYQRLNSIAARVHELEAKETLSAERLAASW